MAQQADNDFLLVHRCRFAQIQPTAITALALNDAESLIAVARENGSIEVWNLLNNFSQQRVCAHICLRTFVRCLELLVVAYNRGPQSRSTLLRFALSSFMILLST